MNKPAEWHEIEEAIKRWPRHAEAFRLLALHGQQAKAVPAFVASCELERENQRALGRLHLLRGQSARLTFTRIGVDSPSSRIRLAMGIPDESWLDDVFACVDGRPENGGYWFSSLTHRWVPVSDQAKFEWEMSGGSSKAAGKAYAKSQLGESKAKQLIEAEEPCYPHIPGLMFGKSGHDIILAMAWEEAAEIFGTDFLITDQKTYLKYQLRMLNGTPGVEQRIGALAQQHHFGQRDWCLVFTQDRNDKFFVQRLRQCRSKRVVNL